jgi:hypothetical protein
MEKKVFKRNDWLKPINRPLKFAFVPKNVHSWYDPVQEGIQKAAAELKQLRSTPLAVRAVKK